MVIAGSRTIDEPLLVMQAVRESGFDITEVFSGHAKGIDQQAERWARGNKKPLRLFIPEYGSFGRRAPIVRNEQMADKADALIAIHDGKSKGTAYIIGAFRKRNKPVYILPWHFRDDGGA